MTLGGSNCVPDGAKIIPNHTWRHKGKEASKRHQMAPGLSDNVVEATHWTGSSFSAWTVEPGIQSRSPRAWREKYLNAVVKYSAKILPCQYSA